MLTRLRVKFVCTNMVIVTSMLLIIFGLVLHFTQRSLELQSLQMMRSIAANPIHFGRPDPVNPPAHIRLPFFSLQVGHAGELLAVDGGYYDLSDQGVLQQLIRISTSANQETGVIPEYSLRYCRIPSPPGERVVFADISSESDTMDTLLRHCALIGSFSFLIFLLISLFLARWAIQPVEKAWAQQRQFVADASHELKTPLTVILTNAELLLSSGPDPTGKEQFAQNILSASGQMRTLTERLLELARVDGDTIQGIPSRLDLSQLTTDAVLPYDPVFFEKGLTLTSRIDEGIYVKGSGDHLRQAVDILLDNAQKYSSTAGETVVSLRRQGQLSCILSVSNPGEALSAEELKHIFRRFYRTDKARTRSGSYGLGLSIAEGIVSAHRGKIWAESREGYNTFFIQLPTA